MISLKKNDKIIIGVAIVVVIAAAALIVLYQEPPKVSSPQTTPSTTQVFNVTWAEENVTAAPVTGFVNKKTPLTLEITIPESNVISATFNITWVDDHATFLGRLGLDTFTVEATTPLGGSITVANTSAKKTREGTISILMMNKGIIPPVIEPITASDYAAAKTQLDGQQYFDNSWTNKNFTIMISDKIGEIRPIPRLLDKGNPFTLQISYQYYQAVLQQGEMKTTGGNGDDGTPQDPWEPPYMSMIISTGCGRFV